MSELNTVLIVTDARLGDPTAIKDALGLYVSLIGRGESVPSILQDWMSECCANLFADFDERNTIALHQKQFANSFGLSRPKGRPKMNGIRDFKVAFEIHHLRISHGLSLEKAISQFVSENPQFGGGVSTDYVWEIWRHYRDEVVPLYEDWISLMEMNSSKH